MSEGGETMGESIDDVVKRVTRAAYTPGNVVHFTAVDLIRVLNELQRLRAENATLRASTDAAVDGVRAMLPAALKVAREEGAAAMREQCAAELKRRADAAHCGAMNYDDNDAEERNESHVAAGALDDAMLAIRALPLDAPAEAKL